MSYELALQTVEYLDNEEEYVPWKTGGGELTGIGTRLRDTAIYGAFQVKNTLHFLLKSPTFAIHAPTTVYLIFVLLNDFFKNL